tara:strand:- start:729 stop:2063 length:1335 start_codon:yes stop_codon:yes gene_type:complete
VNVKIYDKKRFHRELADASKQLEQIRLDNSDFLLKKGTTVESRIQKYILSKSNTESHEKIIKPLILDAIVSAESKSACAGEICLNISSDILSKVLKTISIESISETKLNIENMKRDLVDDISGSRKTFSKSDMNSLISNTFSDVNHRKIAKEIIKNSNIHSPVFLERSNKTETAIHFQDGFLFNINVESSYLPQSGIWKYKNVKCLAIDGMIESVSEIHHLLQEASANKQPYVLFVRSISEEVKNTLLLNLKRGTLNVIPVEVGFDENTLNILNDISICCDSRLISSLTGDLISTAVKDDMITVRQISISKNSVVITSSPDKDKLKNQINYIRSKKDSSSHMEMSSLYDRRLRSLMPGKIVLKVGTDILNKDPGAIERFDMFFRKIRSFVTHGVFKKNKKMKIISKYIEDKNTPYLSVILAIQNSFSFLHSIASIDRIVFENKV